MPTSTEWVGKLETQEESPWCHSNPKAGKLKAQEEPEFQVHSKGRQKLVSQFEHNQAGFILIQERGILFVLFRNSTDWRMNKTGWELPTLGRVTALLKSLGFNINLIQRHAHKNIQKRVQLDIWALVVQSSWQTKLTITICCYFVTVCNTMPHWEVFKEF